MSEEILINVTPCETRVALIENGMLQEVFIERTDKKGHVGNIYKGLVQRVLPGMQAAFIEIGLERTAFLHANDINYAYSEGDNDAPPTPQPINKTLKEGDEVLVQVTKDPLGTKGARLTTNLSIPSRYLVYMPSMRGEVRISRRIEEEDERIRLETIVRHGLEQTAEQATEEHGKAAEKKQNSKRQQGGYIVRTVAEMVAEDDLHNDMRFLQQMMAEIYEQAEKTAPRNMVYQDLPLSLRCIRDMGADVERIRVDSRESYQQATTFIKKYLPDMAGQIEHYPGDRPIFDLYAVEEEIEKALNCRVDLKSGGYLIIDQTESMTTVDVNTGGFVGHRNLDETIFKTNLEAAQSIARQLRLRNIGGIIIIDFIDMEHETHKRRVLKSLQELLQKERAKYTLSGVTELGLVEMTRKRTRESLQHILCSPCQTCNGRGFTRSVESACYDIFRELMREARQFDAEEFLVLASSSVVQHLTEEESENMSQLEEFIGKRIHMRAEPLYNPSEFDIVVM